MRKAKRFFIALVIIVVVSIAAVLIFAPDIIGALMMAFSSEDQNWYNSLNIDTDVEFPYSIEYADEGFLINGKVYVTAEDWNYESVKHLPISEQPDVDRYYIEDSYLGCNNSGYLKAAFGTSPDNVDFILFFGDKPIRKYKWYVSESYVLPDITKDEVSSILIMNKESMLVTYESSADYRVRQSDAVAKITDRTVIDDVIKNKKYVLLNEYIDNDEQYVVLAQFDWHIIYETVTILNDASVQN